MSTVCFYGKDNPYDLVLFINSVLGLEKLGK